MGIESVTCTPKQGYKHFPKLMVAPNGDVVLFESAGRGTLVQSRTSTCLGQHKVSWTMSVFQDYNEPVCVQNKE